MLYSEKEERGNRFKIAIKITFPFVILALIAILFYLKNPNYVLFFALIIIQAYYTLYLIYNGFKENILDDVTRAYNRKTILDLLQKYINRDIDNAFIVLINIDNLENLNERYGLSVTDKILRNFATHLDNFLKDYNFKETKIGYYGGGNFIFGLNGKKNVLEHIFDKFLEDIEHNGLKGREIKLNIEFIEKNYDKNINVIIERLLQEVEAKKRQELINNRLKIKPNEFEKIVCNLIEKRKLSFRFQPIMNTKTKEIDIYEVLIKLNSDKYGLIPQNQFIPIINRIAYEDKFDLILMEEILKIIKKSGNRKRFSVNLSPFSIRKNSFRIQLIELFKNYQLSPSQIIIELYEKRTYRDRIKYIEILEKYQEKGFNMALDNFGGDNSSIEYIKDLPYNYVKFDLEYTKNLKDKRYKLLLIGYLNLFKELNVKTIVKFVDKEETYNELIDLGIDYLQGYQISKPISEQEL